jgi:hypothetical protein
VRAASRLSDIGVEAVFSGDLSKCFGRRNEPAEPICDVAEAGDFAHPNHVRDTRHEGPTLTSKVSASFWKLSSYIAFILSLPDALRLAIRRSPLWWIVAAALASFLKDTISVNWRCAV